MKERKKEASETRQKEEEIKKKQNFYSAINDTQNSIAKNNLGITGREMLLSGNGHAFNMREAKYQAHQNQLMDSSQSNL